MPEKKDNMLNFDWIFDHLLYLVLLFQRKKNCFHVGEINNEIDKFFCWLFFIKTKKAFELRCAMHHTSERLAK